MSGHDEQGLSDPPPARAAHALHDARRGKRGEARVPPAVAILVAVALYAVLPEPLLVGPRFLIPALELVLLVALIATNPLRMTRQTRWSRAVSLVLAVQVWASNVIAFGLIYWELDRGGPVSRTQKPREELPLADFRFTQDETQDTVIEVAAGSSKKADWIPTFVDYLYLSTTNSSAFSPTDTMPLTSRAKVLMAVQATAASITSLLVIARAVGALGGDG